MPNDATQPDAASRASATPKRGRKPWLSETVLRNISLGVQAGLPDYVCARASGVSPDTLSKWMGKGRKALARHGIAPPEWPDDKEPPVTLDHIPADLRMYARLAREVEIARALGEVSLVRVIQKAIVDGDVGSAKWLLERRYRKRYGAPQRPMPGTLSDPNAGVPEDDEGDEIVFTLDVPHPPRLPPGVRDGAPAADGGGPRQIEGPRGNGTKPETENEDE